LLASGVSVKNVVIGVAVAAGVIFLVGLCVYRKPQLYTQRLKFIPQAEFEEEE